MSYAAEPCCAVEWRMACATAFLSALVRDLASLSRKVINELRRSLGAKGTHTRLALEHGLHDLGPAPRVERLCVVDAAATQHEHVRPVPRSLSRRCAQYHPLTLQHL